ncbi:MULTISPECIES: phosphatidate cytidylyltransferase [unclassified Oleiphilus]|uniref:phosphatidate cytidylyltransferase n=1 Tax=unclassified Oleiphilus TaxID=2631174 RepID=UPI0007C20691|nr:MULTISPECIES: phosphatidate cytidylyltransferase [unclassified Oleiphilus]KZY47043.1 phosphatidate cytidylyltransferase [Oleiphilus sp. HI0050]KZZ33684.1 phosphatidate cytidylyltransferase [Oleiphilus sp. HI0086]KZZ37226.1 phosphatidate cytidylyltransferase [Oleiphilus sp. HI0117]KZZ53519.1 phosphatidate cytidylyltransferase [Oleiphilus sp. HI0123]
MLKQRIITALILAPLVLGGVFLLPPEYFSWFVAAIVILGAWEWANLSGVSASAARVVYALVMAVFLFLLVGSMSLPWVLTLSVAWWALACVLVMTFPESSSLWKGKIVQLLLGFVVLAPLWKALVFLRSSEYAPLADLNVLWLIFYILMLVWAADTGAYFAGRAFGKKKLAPKVSPGKSWAGAWGGLAACLLLSLIASNLLEHNFAMTIQFAVISTITGSISIIGDLTESMFKRQRGIKDSSNLLPGHGGVLDRIDSLVAAIPVFVFALYNLSWVA